MGFSEILGIHFIWGLRKWSTMMEHGNWIFVYAGSMAIVDAKFVSIT